MSVKSYPRMHTSLYVSNLSESVSFYKNFFGQEPSKVRPGYAKFELEEPGLTLSFVENAERVKSNFGHMGIQVDSLKELNDRHARIKANGLTTLQEDGVACCYAVQDKFWVKDPDGHQWEIYFFHQDAEWHDPKYSNIEKQASPVVPAKTEDGGSCC